MMKSFLISEIFVLLLFLFQAISTACLSHRVSRQYPKSFNAFVSTTQSPVSPGIPDGFKNALSSALATILAKSILQPLDTVKTVQQLQMSKLSLLGTAREILLTRGPFALWSGTLVSAVGSAPAAAVYYGIFSSIKSHLAKVLPKEYRFIAVAAAATFSNSVAAVFRVPYEVYKQRLQAGMHQSIFEAVQFSWEREGLLGLFASGKLTSQIIRDVPYAIITAVVYDILQIFMNRIRFQCIKSESTFPQSKKEAIGKYYQLQDAFCGAAAGGISSFFTTPMDVVKTRLMTTNSYSSFLHATKTILRDEGFTTFFAGSTSRVLHKIPANALFFVFYEAFRFMFGAVSQRSEQ